MKRLLLIAAAVVSLGLATAVIGGAVTSAQEGDGPLSSFLSKVADKLGVSEDELKTAIDEARDETIDEAVADGRLTEEQGERLKERAAEGGFPFLGPRDGRHHGRPGVCHRVGGLILDAAAEVLDMPKGEVVAQLRSGGSLAEIAEAQGMEVDEFTEALLEEVEAQLDEKVEQGDLTQEQADRILQGIQENIDHIVNGHPRPHGRCHPGPHMDGPNESQTETGSDGAFGVPEPTDVTA